MRMSIAIDGPAGAGKSTIAKILGEKYKLMYINTGAMYRAVALYAMNEGIKPDEIKSICDLVNSLEMHFDKDNLIVNAEDITNEITMPLISNNVSNYAAIPEVRAKLVEMQRNIAKKYSVIMDGRDIGTVVLKDANLKFFLTASAEERAKRRYEELDKRGIEVNYNNILEDIIKRDYIDTHREADPLVKAEDAIEVDSSNLDIYGVVDLISTYIDKLLATL
ncbi:(d)CMP kinase [Clostridium sp.]|uniref:(d)CMP kinase n=1 Tax=Clostridium sp. TaxID=1506 RepID=UPI002FC9CD59